MLVAVVVADDTRGGAEAESKVSQFVVTITGPDVECLDGCGSCICLGKWPTECLASCCF